jgi:hypothetical protein
MNIKTKSPKHCHCGQLLHFKDDKDKQNLAAAIDEYGEFIEVRERGRVFKVPRSYIYLHGIRGKELAKLGFKEL